MMRVPQKNKRAYIRGAALLGATILIAKILSFIYKWPLLNLLGDAGAGHFQVTYQIYAVLLTIATAGIPVALSRLISASSATGHRRQSGQYFSVALLAYTTLGIVLSAAMFLFAPQLALLVKDTQAEYGIRALAPAVLLVCMVSVYEGYGQAHNDLVPTTVKQISEVLCKLLLGLAAVWWLLSRGYGMPVVSAGAVIGAPVGLLIALLILIAHKRKCDSAEWAGVTLYPHDRPDGRRKTLRSLLAVSIPVTLGASIMSVITLIDTAVVRDRLFSAAGFPMEQVDVLYGVYSKALTLLVLPSAFIVPITVTVIPVMTAALASRRPRDASRIAETSLKLTNILAIPAGLGLSVLSFPIFNVLYPGSNLNGPACLLVFGIASYFVCAQLMTTAILQAYGHERSVLPACLIGGAAQILVDFLLVANPKIGIVGSPVGTLVCYFLITVINLIFIRRKTGCAPHPAIFLKPAFCAAVMAAAAWSVYELLYKVCSGTLGTGRFALILYLFAAVAAASIVYILLAVATKTVTREDMKLLPRGEKLADLLRMP
jgi:stage V sporulation protein B